MKKILVVIVMLVISLGGAVLADSTIYRYDGHYEVKFNGQEIFKGDETEVVYIADCVIKDNIITVTGPDPRFAVIASGQESSVIRIIFGKPVSQDTMIQVFYEKEDEGFSESNSKRTTAMAGTTELQIFLPKDDYSTYRFDIESDVFLEGIYAGIEEIRFFSYQPHAFRLSVLFCAIFISTCVIVLKLSKRKKCV